jgi:hypothetical protein
LSSGIVRGQTPEDTKDRKAVPGNAAGSLKALLESIPPGKDGINRSQINPAMVPKFDRIAERLGSNDGQISRDQMDALKQRRKDVRMTEATAAKAEAAGMPAGTLPKETKTALKSTSPRNEENAPSRSFYPNRAPSRPDSSKPLVYRTSNLPKELPAWFKQIDLNQDAQISLYEWKTANRSLEEFQRIDRNNDGFLSVDEVLRYEAARKAGPAMMARGGATSIVPVSPVQDRNRSR